MESVPNMRLCSAPDDATQPQGACSSHCGELVWREGGAVLRWRQSVSAARQGEKRWLREEGSGRTWRWEEALGEAELGIEERDEFTLQCEEVSPKKRAAARPPSCQHPKWSRIHWHIAVQAMPVWTIDCGGVPVQLCFQSTSMCT